MFFSDVVSGIFRLFTLFILPFILIHAGFTRLAGGRVDCAHYVRFCLWFLHSIFRAMLKGSTSLADKTASALPAKYAHWKGTVKLLLRLAIIAATLLGLMICLACFSHADYPLNGLFRGL